MMKKLTLQESFNIADCKPTNFSPEFWMDDGCILDMEHFIKTLTHIKAKGVHPEFIGSIITYYATKWLPELSDSDSDEPNKPTAFQDTSISTSWMKKRFLVETLIRILPQENTSDNIACNFLLRLLRVANIVGVQPVYKAELEKRISWQLDQASLKEIMIPSFNHTRETLLDVDIVLRLVKRFLSLDDGFKTAASMIKVAKLVDNYLAEAAVDINLTLPEFMALAGALPPFARSSDDGLYRAIDTFLKVHPGLSKQERKSLCNLMDSRKLSQEASLHAAQNERLPVRAVIQVLFSEQAKLINKQMDWSTGSFSSTRSPNIGHVSKREVNVQNMEIKKLKQEIKGLQSHCKTMQAHIDMLMEKKKAGPLFSWSWRKFSMPSFGGSRSGDVEKGEGFWRQTPAVDVKTRLQNSKLPRSWRKSLS